MAQIIGIGGVFFKSKDPKSLCQWYREHLNLSGDSSFDGSIFPFSTQPPKAYSVWSAFPDKSDHFDPSTKDYMINFIVDDVDEALAQVAAGGAKVLGEAEDSEYGRFGWFLDPEGNKIEIWKPSS